MAKPIAQKRGLNSRLLEVLSYSGYPHLAGELIRGRVSTACRGVAKGLAIRVVQSSPCDSFLELLADVSIGLPEEFRCERPRFK